MLNTLAQNLNLSGEALACLKKIIVFFADFFNVNTKSFKNQKCN